MNWEIEDLKTKYFSFRHLLDTTKTIANDGFECAYKDGMITIVLNPALKPYFIELAHYSIYELKHYMHFTSWYSLRMFELLSAFKDTRFFLQICEKFTFQTAAAAATTLPNLVRGTVVLMTMLFGYFKNSFSIIESGALVGILCFLIGIYSTLTIAETHDKDLDFLEE